jgi:hypothetical protein
MGMIRRMIMIAGLGLLLGCMSSPTSTPSRTPATASNACLAAWRSYLATGSDGVTGSGLPDEAMRACQSLDEVVAGYVATYTGKPPAVEGPQGWARSLVGLECSTGKFNDTLICEQFRITPSTGQLN